MLSVSEKIFCAFCKIPRTTYMKKHITWVNGFLAILVSFVCMIIFWRDFDARVFIFFVGFLALAETFVQMRWRLSICCPHCGFDPVLYIKDPEAMVARVKGKLDEVRRAPDYFLRKVNPLAQLPKIKKDPQVFVRELSEISKEPIIDSDLSLKEPPGAIEGP